MLPAPWPFWPYSPRSPKPPCSASIFLPVVLLVRRVLSPLLNSFSGLLTSVFWVLGSACVETVSGWETSCITRHPCYTRWYAWRDVSTGSALGCKNPTLRNQSVRGNRWPWWLGRSPFNSLCTWWDTYYRALFFRLFWFVWHWYLLHIL